ncbi:dihydrofolate reductase family protein [Actinoplanes hulinensis]|uniref:Dihydrofolate reductase family protein n=1 Tax=Actinoplanes hulinensis TaxID=1144547 RepID=A0ABS7B8I2_9ACTN|nr:dihydrofolate reductase family protein [Actinoplanes hulinensis]MBW6437336.1 dihydrofolate reductase family protein [Actinoplanes hulinensis]
MAFVTASISVSVDGFVAGKNQAADRPLGEAPAIELHRWLFETPEENRPEIEAHTDAGAYIMGRNMFGPIRGEWDLSWTGWWGDEPPYHKPVFVLTHHPREDQSMAGGTTFHFVTGGIHDAFDRAREATGDGRIMIAGGASTVNQYLAAGLIDQLTLNVVPVMLGAGERLFDGIPPLKLEQIGSRAASLVTHITYRVG